MGHNSPVFLLIHDIFLLLPIITCFHTCAVCSLLYSCAPSSSSVSERQTEMQKRKNIWTMRETLKEMGCKIYHVDYSVNHENHIASIRTGSVLLFWQKNHEYYFMTQIQVHAFRANNGAWFQNHPYFCGLKFGCSTQCGNLMVLIRLSISHPVWV